MWARTRGGACIYTVGTHTHKDTYTSIEDSMWPMVYIEGDIVDSVYTLTLTEDELWWVEDALRYYHSALRDSNRQGYKGKRIRELVAQIEHMLDGDTCSPE